mmetsp:Transcript_34249/g.107459  ORF Transcript_34249/g.107459 Transcript_34249/m.107459 type:complete len:210 (+) Transcript_34249:209-838(+)
MITSSSASVRKVHAPGLPQLASVMPAKPTRCSLITSSPQAAHMRRICRFRPSSSTNRSRAGWAGEASRSTTQGRVRAVSGLARPSDWATVVMTTPAARRAMSASVAGTCVVTRYSFCFRSPARSSVLVRPPSEVSKMSPLLSLSRRPTGKRRSRTPSTSPSSSRMLPRAIGHSPRRPNNKQTCRLPPPGHARLARAGPSCRPRRAASTS